jgi:predicted CXXCH cytochrome family protein
MKTADRTATCGFQPGTILVAMLAGYTAFLVSPRSSQATSRPGAGNWAGPNQGAHACSYCHDHADGDQGQALAAVPGPPAAGSSKRCLTCHDDSIAVSVTHRLVSAQGKGGMNDHPVGIPYPSGPGYHPVPVGVRLFEIDGVRRVECASCHDPHDTRAGAMLRMQNNRSQLCLACHDL